MGKVTHKRIEVNLTEREVNLVKWFAKNDDTTIQQQLQKMFYDELNRLMDLYGEEMEDDMKAGE